MKHTHTHAHTHTHTHTPPPHTHTHTHTHTAQTDRHKGQCWSTENILRREIKWFGLFCWLYRGRNVWGGLFFLLAVSADRNCCERISTHSKLYLVGVVGYSTLLLTQLHVLPLWVASYQHRLLSFCLTHTCTQHHDCVCSENTSHLHKKI